MSIRIFEDVGAGKLNQAQKVGRVESVGPITVVVMCLSAVANVIMSFVREKSGLAVLSDRDTAVSAEDTGYLGNGTDLVFSGQVLNHLPILPRTIVLTPATSGPVLRDVQGDGYLYLPDGVTKSGQVNYFTGALELQYPSGTGPGFPTGYAPDGIISADYAYQDALLVHGGQRNYSIVSNGADDAVVIYATADDKEGARVKVESAATWM